MDSLPFDIFYQVVTSLNGRDYINLSRTNQNLYIFLNKKENDLIARKIIESTSLHSKEGQSALAGQTSYHKALGHRCDIHEAIATAAPYAVSVLGYGADFLYNQGFLSYRTGNEIRQLNLHGAGCQESVLDLHGLGYNLAKLDVTLLYFNDGIIAFRVKREESETDELLAIDMDRPGQPLKTCLLLQKAIPTDNLIFVRHNRSYIWYGIFTPADGFNGHWAIYGRDFVTSEEIEFTLDGVISGNLDQTLCFEMHQEHLYAVSTQMASSSDDDERWSSFYRWVCLGPREKGCNWKGCLWRREHREGPTNELWTNLSIHKDEMDGRPVILECRREWRGGNSENHRTYYIEPLPTTRG